MFLSDYVDICYNRWESSDFFLHSADCRIFHNAFFRNAEQIKPILLIALGNTERQKSMHKTVEYLRRYASDYSNADC